MALFPSGMLEEVQTPTTQPTVTYTDKSGTSQTKTVTFRKSGNIKSVSISLPGITDAQVDILTNNIPSGYAPLGSEYFVGCSSTSMYRSALIASNKIRIHSTADITNGGFFATFLYM